MHAIHTLSLAGLIALAGCDDTAEKVHEQTDPCAKVDVLSEALGCQPSSGCEELQRECRDEAGAFIDCAATDLSQCMCESDDDELNCEGAYKPSEGQARCQSEYAALSDCQER